MKRKKICVVGSGNWGKNHVKTLEHMGVLGGIVEIDKDLIKKLKLKYPKCNIFPSLNRAFNENFDAYVIATPAATHYDIAREVIKNRKSLLVEKPLTLDYLSAVKLCDYADQMGVQIMVGHVLLFHPAFQKMKQIIDEGKIGDIQYIYSNRLNLGKFRTNENVFWSFAPHDISLFQYFFNQDPISITSRGIDIVQKNIHDSSITIFEYENKKMGHIFVSWLHPFKEHRFVIIGENGMLHYEDSYEEKPLLYHDKKVEFIDKVPSPRFGDVKKMTFKNEHPLENELKYFISKLDGGKIEIASGRDGAAVIRMLESATKDLTIKRS